jgi:hypothetical protein
MCPSDDLVSPQSAIFALGMKNNYVYHDCLKLVVTEVASRADVRSPSHQVD